MSKCLVFGVSPSEPLRLGRRGLPLLLPSSKARRQELRAAARKWPDSLPNSSFVLRVFFFFCHEHFPFHLLACHLVQIKLEPFIFAFWLYPPSPSPQHSHGRPFFSSKMGPWGTQDGSLGSPSAGGCSGMKVGSLSAESLLLHSEKAFLQSEATPFTVLFTAWKAPPPRPPPIISTLPSVFASSLSPILCIFFSSGFSFAVFQES